jgi:hypothetical protein
MELGQEGVVGGGRFRIISARKIETKRNSVGNGRVS